MAEPTKLSRWSLLPDVAAVAVGAVVSLIFRTVNVVVLTAATLSLRSVARYSTLARWAASPSSAGEPNSRARRARKAETPKFASAENPITAIPMPRCETSAPTTSRRVAAKTMIPAPTRISIPSIAAAKFSTFS